MSDMAPNISGNKAVDQPRAIGTSLNSRWTWQRERLKKVAISSAKCFTVPEPMSSFENPGNDLSKRANDEAGCLAASQSVRPTLVARNYQLVVVSNA